MIFGGEGSGISKQVLKNSDFLATIPMSHEMNSLNVATAVSAIVFESLDKYLVKFGELFSCFPNSPYVLIANFFNFLSVYPLLEDENNHRKPFWAF